MNILFLNAIAMPYKFGRLPLFIAFTCNLKWPDIVENILKLLKPADEPDIVYPEFQFKIRLSLNSLRRRMCLVL